MSRLWNLAKRHPNATAAIIGVAALVVSVLSFARDVTDWTLGPGRQTSTPSSSAPVQATGAPPVPHGETASGSATMDVLAGPPSRGPVHTSGALPKVPLAQPERTVAPTRSPAGPRQSEARRWPSSQTPSSSQVVKVSMTTTNYLFLSARPITTAQDNPREGVHADLQSGPGWLHSRGSTDFAPIPAGVSCRQATPWTRDPFPLGRGSVADFCLALTDMRPIRYFTVHLVVDNTNTATMTFSDS